MELKNKCKLVRETVGLSQKEFGEMFLKTNQTEVSFIERGFIPEDRRKVKVINNLYNVMVDNNIIKGVID